MTERIIEVLLVEDDEDDYLLTSEVFEEVDGTAYKLTWCKGLEEVRTLQANGGLERFDVSLVDFRLGPHTGLDVIRHFTASGLSVPCIMLTGQVDGEADRQALALGAEDFLVKGRFNAEQIERSIRYAIGNAAVMTSLRESEARFRSVVESATDGIVLLDNSGIVLAANRATSKLVGRPIDELTDRSCLEFLNDASVHRLGDVLNIDSEDGRLNPPVGQSVNSKPIEAQIIHRSGRLVPVELTVSSWISGDQRFWSVIVRDVTERKAMSEQLEYQAFHDPLTGLANRTFLKDKIDNRLRSAAIDGEVAALIFVDLDNFKLVNDTFGHEAGDELLAIVAGRLLDCVRTSDTVARLGGDEFAVFLHTVTSVEAAAEIAHRLVEALSEPVELGGLPMIASGSAGVALADGGLISDELLRNADVAMYNAKAQGKNRMSIFEVSMHDTALQRLRLEQDLRASLAEGGIGIAYQPIINLSDRSIRGFEALARWTHPDHGVVTPDVFIAIAEDAGMIEQLGRSVMNRAVHDTANLQRHLGRPLSVSVNLSTRQLEDKLLVQNTRGLLLDSGLAPGSLTLEVTESVMVGHVERAIRVLNELRDLDVKLALDDFGTGYSSLSYLHLLPLDTLKADRSFVTRHGEPAGAGLLRAVVVIARSLGLRTVAEGIEDEHEERAVRSFGYDFGQGYLFSKPVAFEALTELLEAHRVGV